MRKSKRLIVLLPGRMSGRRVDPETGLYYYRARYYSPKLGRFLQTDPIGVNGEMNLYVYASNNAVGLADAFGLYPNQAAATNASAISETIRASRSLEVVEKTHSESSRYFYTDQFGWIDAKHFARAANLVVNGRHPNDVRVLGFGVELTQALQEAVSNRLYRSAFSPEDLPSNEAGVQFGIYYGARSSYMSMERAFDEWAERSGARPRCWQRQEPTQSKLRNQ